MRCYLRYKGYNGSGVLTDYEHQSPRKRNSNKPYWVYCYLGDFDDSWTKEEIISEARDKIDHISDRYRSFSARFEVIEAAKVPKYVLKQDIKRIELDIENLQSKMNDLVKILN